jgi:hypothetical protein
MRRWGKPQETSVSLDDVPSGIGKESLRCRRQKRCCWLATKHTKHTKHLSKWFMFKEVQWLCGFVFRAGVCSNKLGLYLQGVNMWGVSPWEKCALNVMRSHSPLGCPASPGCTRFLWLCLRASPGCRTIAHASSWKWWPPPACSACNTHDMHLRFVLCSLPGNYGYHGARLSLVHTHGGEYEGYWDVTPCRLIEC